MEQQKRLEQEDLCMEVEVFLQIPWEEDQLVPSEEGAALATPSEGDQVASKHQPCMAPCTCTYQEAQVWQNRPCMAPYTLEETQAWRNRPCTAPCTLEEARA